MTDTLTRQAANFVAGFSASSAPPELLWRAKSSVLDLLGCAVLGSAGETSESYLAFANKSSTSPAESTVVADSAGRPAHLTALLNGTYAHSTELSETYTRAAVHPGNAIIPAVLAVAERDKRSGIDVLESTITAYEVVIRLGLSLGRDLMLKQGLHIPTVAGAFGAAVGVGKVSHLSGAELDDLLGITACLVPTALIQAALEGASVKDIFEGTAAATGVTALDLKLAGIEGVSDGMANWASMSRTFSPELLVSGLGREWLMLSGGLHFKERALLAMAQPSLNAARRVAEEIDDVAAIQRILVETSGRSSLAAPAHPSNIVAAKGSIAFVVAASLVHPQLAVDDPHFIRSIDADLLADPAVARVADLVEIRVDPEIDRQFEVDWPMKFAARVSVVLRDGRQVEHYEDIWERTSTMDFDTVAAKFESITEDLLPAAARREIVRTVRGLESEPDIARLMALTNSGKSGPTAA